MLLPIGIDWKITTRQNSYTGKQLTPCICNMQCLIRDHGPLISNVIMRDIPAAIPTTSTELPKIQKKRVATCNQTKDMSQNYWSEAHKKDIIPNVLMQGKYCMYSSRAYSWMI